MSPLVIATAGAMTLVLRGALLVRGPSPWEQQAEPYLKRVPAAVLPALAASALLAQVSGPDGAARVVAAVAAVLVAVRSRSLLVTLVFGMAALHGLVSLGV